MYYHLLICHTTHFRCQTILKTLPQTDSCVITECSIMYYNKGCSFFCILQFSDMTFRTQFLIQHALSIVSIHYLGLHSFNYVCWDCNIIIYLFTVQNCGPRKSVSCAPQRRLQILMQDHFLLTHFTTLEGICLNRLVVPCGLDSASHSTPQSSPPLLPTCQQLCLSRTSTKCLIASIVWSVPSQARHCVVHLVTTSLRMVNLPSRNWQIGWIIDIAAVQHMWRMMKRVGFDYLETQAWIKIPLRTHLVLFICAVVQTVTQL